MSPAATAAARAADDATLTRARAKRLLVYGALVSMPAAVALGRAPIGCGRGVLRGCGVAPHVPVLAALALGASVALLSVLRFVVVVGGGDES